MDSNLKQIFVGVFRAWEAAPGELNSGGSGAFKPEQIIVIGDGNT